MLNLFKKTLTEEQIKQLDQTVAKFKKNPHQFRFTVIFFLTSILFGILSVYLLQQKFALLMQKDGKVEIKEIIKRVEVPQEDQPIIEPDKEATDEAMLIQNSWKLKKNDPCNILALVPPYEIKDNQEKWVYQTNNQKDLGVFTQMTFIEFQKTNKIDEAFIYPKGKVSIYCADNTEEWDASTLVNKIRESLEIDKADDTTIKSSEEDSMWDKTVQKIKFSEGSIYGDDPYYAMTTDQHLYLISKSNSTENENILKDTKTIFENLVFLD